MNKRILLATGAAVLTLTALGGMNKANAVTDTGVAEAVILQAITVDCNVTLDFGNISPSALAGVVTVDTTGAGSGDANATYVSGAQAGSCDIDGDAAVAADISVSATVPLDDAGAGAAMALSSFTFDYDGGGEVNAPILGATLAPAGATLLVGADLAVGANQVAGNYTGSFTIDVSYQ